MAFVISIKGSSILLCCLLYPVSANNNISPFERSKGFNKWKEIEKLAIHENSSNDRYSFRTWKEYEWIIQRHQIKLLIKSHQQRKGKISTSTYTSIGQYKIFGISEVTISRSCWEIRFNVWRQCRELSLTTWTDISLRSNYDETFTKCERNP